MAKLVKIGLGAGVFMAGFAALPASAQIHSFGNSTVSGPVSARHAANDPNRKICVTEDEIGTRLATKHICRTAAEWVAYRREIRDTVDRIQAMKISKE
jgi:hypothetical protein